MQALTDHILFYKRNDTSIILFIVYVDGMIVICNSTGEIERLRSYLPKDFKIKDLGNMKYLLGLKFINPNNTLSLRIKIFLSSLG